jgi:hypothetical protein
MATTDTEFTPAGTMKVQFPAVVKDCDPGGVGVTMVLLAVLAILVPMLFVAETVKV